MAGPDNTGHDADEGARAEEIRVGWRMAGLGMHVTSEVLAGLLLGWLFDLWRGTAPTGATVGAIIGIVIGLFSLVRGSMKVMKELDARHPTAGRGRSAVGTSSGAKLGAKAPKTDAAADEPPPSHEMWKRQWREEWEDRENDSNADDDRHEH